MDDKFFLAMVDKFNSSDIAELDFNDGNIRLFLRKDISPQTENIPVNRQETSKPSSLQAPGDNSVHLGISAHASGKKTGGGEKIKSPIVATFYASPGPDAPPFVKAGTNIKAGQTLCILEAMKMMNHLEAEFDCEIIEVLVSSGELVEYGQELFTVKKN